MALIYNIKSGTLKSTLISTLLPFKSTSSIVFFAIIISVTLGLFMEGYDYNGGHSQCQQDYKEQRTHPIKE